MHFSTENIVRLKRQQWRIAVFFLFSDWYAENNHGLRCLKEEKKSGYNAYLKKKAF